MIFVDTNVFYSVLVKTEFSLAARNIVMMLSKLDLILQCLLNRYDFIRCA